MEQLLNLTWLISIGGIVAVIFAQPHRSPYRKNWHITVVTIACLAMLLFPVISVTDDLSNSILTDDPSWRDGKRARVMFTLLAVTIVVLALGLARQSVLSRVISAPIVTRAGYLRLEGGRAPPVFL